MEQVIIFVGGDCAYNSNVRVDFESLMGTEVKSVKELRLKVRGVLLAQLDELVGQISDTYCETCFITKAGQRVSEQDLQLINSIPNGYGVVTHASWRATHACWEDWSSYFVPAGSTLPDGNKLKEGEWIQLKYNWYDPGTEGERLKAFFRDTRNLVNWEKQWDESDVEDAES